MNTVAMVLLFLFAVAVSRVLIRVSPIKFPLPLLQIALGAVLSLVGFNVQLDPNIFFLIFIPPLLFLDGWRIPKNTLRNDWRPILTLALGLVVFTVIGLGFLIDAMIPAVPLAVAFAVAAIVSPTDTVAVTAITAGAPAPPRLLNILEGESLFNDASGLVCFNFAVAAAMTGGFSPGHAALSFLKIAVGGLITGAVIAWGASAIYRWLSRRIGEEMGTPTLVSILIPFAVYLLAERFGLSGILAAVAAGIVVSYVNVTERSSAMARMRRTSIWEMLEVTLNGIIFVLLGEQLPRILTRAPYIVQNLGVRSPWMLAVYVVAIMAALAALRLVWTWASFEWEQLFARLRGKPRQPPSLWWLLFTALSGVKGAITLAGILTLPLFLLDGSAFPARDLAIFLAMGVILLSLITASIGLPLIAKRLPAGAVMAAGDEEQAARVAAIEAAIARVLELQKQVPEDSAQAEAAARILARYRNRLELGGTADSDAAAHLREVAQVERKLRMAALDAERKEVTRLRLTHRIDDPLQRRLIREIDLEETDLSSGRYDER
ncbi:MAG: Na+/H+ antiporter [Gammaproteobacteria bacterium]